MQTFRKKATRDQVSTMSIYNHLSTIQGVPLNYDEANQQLVGRLVNFIVALAM